MKAIILAAGLGRRMGALTQRTPKARLVLGGRSLIERQLELFRDAGIADVALVVGYRRDDLVFANVETYVNADYATTNVLRSLFAAEAELNDDVVITYSDIAYEQSVLQRLLEAAGDHVVVADLEWRRTYADRPDNPPEDAELVVIDGQTVRRIGKGIDRRDATAEFIGLSRFSRDGVLGLRRHYDRVLRGAVPLARGVSVDQAYLTDLFQVMIDDSARFDAIEIRGGWVEIDTPADYARAMDAPWLGARAESRE